MPIFSSDALAKVIKETLPEVPAGKTIAVVGMFDKNGAKIIISFRRDWGHTTWQAFGSAQHDWDVQGGAGTKLEAKLLVTF